MSKLLFFCLIFFSINVHSKYSSEYYSIESYSDESFSDSDEYVLSFDIDKGYPTYQDWIHFGEDKDISVILPLNTEESIEEFRNKSKIGFRYFNDIIPSVIIECLSERDVVETMKFLSNKKYRRMPFSIKSGGHTYGGYSKLQGGAMIILSKLQDITLIDRKNGIISLEPGVTNIGAASFLNDNDMSDMAFVFGACQGVAMGGLITGGGISVFSRPLGVAVDAVIGVRVVLYNGEIIDTFYDNEYGKYDDLLWAIKGSGGGNFGVITKYYLESSEFVDENTKFARISDIQWVANDKEDIYNFFMGLKSLMNNKRFQYIGFVAFSNGETDDGYPLMQLNVAESGLFKDDENNTKIIDAIIESMNEYMNKEPFNDPILRFDEYYGAWMQRFGLGSFVNTDIGHIDISRSVMSWNGDKVARIISNGFYQLIKQFNQNEESPIQFRIIWEMMEGQVLDSDHNFKRTSFQNREAIGVFHLRYSADNYEQQGIITKYLRILDETILDKISNKKYVNYVQNLTGNAELCHYYPNKKVFNKVRRIKSKYDPNNRFKFELSIPPK